MSIGERRGNAFAEAVEDPQVAAQLACADSGERVQPLRAIAALCRGLALAKPDQLATLEPVQHGVEDAERQRMPVRPDLVLDRECIRLPSATQDRQHHQLFVGSQHARPPGCLEKLYSNL